MLLSIKFQSRNIHICRTVNCDGFSALSSDTQSANLNTCCAPLFNDRVKQTSDWRKTLKINNESCGNLGQFFFLKKIKFKIDEHFTVQNFANLRYFSSSAEATRKTIGLVRG